MSNVLKVARIGFTALLLAFPAVALADEAPVDTHGAATDATAAADSGITWKVFAGASVGSGLVLLGAGFGIGRIGGSAVESIARQPEVAAKIQTAMIISAALIEGATFFALIVCLLTILL